MTTLSLLLTKSRMRKSLSEKWLNFLNKKGQLKKKKKKIAAD